MTNKYKAGPTCPVATMHATAAEMLGSSEASRLVVLANQLTPESLEGAHHQMVGIDIALEELHGEVNSMRNKRSIEEIQARVTRLIQFTRAATGLPA